jgi:hypothetical protein
MKTDTQMRDLNYFNFINLELKIKYTMP